MQWLKGAVQGKVCDRAGAIAYYNALSFADQLDLLTKMSQALQKPVTNTRVVKAACNEETILQFYTQLQPQKRLQLIDEMLKGLKNVPNANNMSQYKELTNEELNEQLRKLEENMEGGRRRYKRRGTTRTKRSRRRLTRRRR